MAKTSVWTVAAILSFAVSGNAAQADTLTMSVWVPRTHSIYTKMLVPWAEQVKAATNGAVSLRALPKAVTGPREHFNAVRDGLTDVTFIVHGYTPGRFILAKGVELPFLADDAASLSVAYWRMHHKFFAEKNEHEGVKLLSVFTQGPGQMFNARKPINSVSDLEGMKFRLGGAARDVAKALDVVAVSKPVNQLYELMSKGVTDGVFVPKESVASFRIEKVIRYGTIVPGGLYRAGFALIMSPKKFAALSPEHQKAVMSVSGEAFARMAGNAWDAADAHGDKVMREAGVELKTASPELVAQIAKRLSGLERQWVEDAKGKGVDGAAFLAALRSEVKKVAAAK